MPSSTFQHSQLANLSDQARQCRDVAGATNAERELAQAVITLCSLLEEANVMLLACELRNVHQCRIQHAEGRN